MVPSLKEFRWQTAGCIEANYKLAVVENVSSKKAFAIHLIHINNK
jgi:hypothetical protein